MNQSRLLIAVINLLAATPGFGMDAPSLKTIEVFKNKVDFERTVAADVQALPIRLILPEILRAPGLKDGTWKISWDRHSRVPDGDQREIVLRRGQETITITLFTSFKGVVPAHYFLLTRATQNNMMESPFEKFPTELGTLAVSLKSAEDPTHLIWVYRNIGFEVRADKSKFDVLELARWLQGAPKADLSLGNKNLSKLTSARAKPTITELDALKIARKNGFSATWPKTEIIKGNWHISGISKSLVPPSYFVINGTSGAVLYENQNTSVYPVPSW